MSEDKTRRGIGSVTIVQGAFFPVPPIRGGAVEKLWYQLGREFARKGLNVVHISRHHDELPNEECVAGVRYFRVRGYNQPASPILLKLRDLLYSLRACRRVPPSDVVVTNTFWAPILLGHSHPVYVSVERGPKGQMRLYRRAVRLRAPTMAVANKIVAEDPRAASRITVIPNPLPFMADRPMRTEVKKRTILYVGRLHPEKGITLLLRAFLLAKQRHALDGWTLRLIGSAAKAAGGGGERWLEELKAQFGHPNIIWLQAIYDIDQLNGHYESAELFAYPSLADSGESFGLAVLEAMAWGAVPIVSCNPCFTDFVHHGVNGFVFDHRVPDAVVKLADTLCLAAQAKLPILARQALGVRKTHSVPVIAQRFLDDFDAIKVACSSVGQR